MKKIAIMTAGGDCAGLNAAIKSVVMAASKNNIVVVGIIDGFIGFVERKYMVLDNKIVENIERQGGTILGSSNKERRQKLLGKYGINRAPNHSHITSYKISSRN